MGACCCALRFDNKAAVQPYVVVCVSLEEVGEMPSPMITGGKHQLSVRDGLLTFKAFPQHGEKFQALKNFTQRCVKDWCKRDIALKDCRFENADGAHLKAGDVIFDRVRHSQFVYLVRVEPDVVAQSGQALFNVTWPEARAFAHGKGQTWLDAMKAARP